MLKLRIISQKSTDLLAGRPFSGHLYYPYMFTRAVVCLYVRLVLDLFYCWFHSRLVK